LAKTLNTGAVTFDVDVSEDQIREMQKIDETACFFAAANLSISWPFS